MAQVDPSIQFTEERKKAHAAEPVVKVEVDLGSGYFEINNVINAGNISRSVQWDTGKFSPGSCSIVIDNTDMMWSDSYSGSYTYQLRYHGKPIAISIGFKLSDGSIEYLPQYDGIINAKTENHMNKTVTISTYDIFKMILDFKVARKEIASSYFEYTGGGADDRYIQNVIAMGEHRLPGVSIEEVKKKDDPFNIVLCRTSLDNSINNRPAGSSLTYRGYGYWWYIPIENDIDTPSLSSDFYYWDYAADTPKWKHLIVTGAYQTYGNNKYLELTSATQADDDGSVNWTDYLAGTGAFAESGNPNTNREAKIAIASKTDTADLNNPAKQIYYLLTDSKFLGLTTGLIDKLDWTDSTYTFDSAFIALNNVNVKSLADYKSPISLLNVCEDISEVSNLVFYSTQKLSAAADRRIKLQSDQPVFIPEDPEILNDDYINSLSLISDLTNMNNKVTMESFQYDENIGGEDVTLSIAENTTSSTAYGKREMSIGGDVRSGATIYDSEIFASDVVGRVLKRIEEPENTVEIETDLYALPFFLKKDVINLKNVELGIDDNYQIKKINVSYNSTKIKVELSKFGSLFGPDITDPTQKWAFADYAYADEDDDGNSYHAY